MKDVLRYSKKRSGTKESSAEHSWRLALMAFMTVKELNLGIDVLQSVKLALVHDVVESITGDIDAVRIFKKEVSKEEKQRLEEEAIEKLKDILLFEAGLDIYELWQEYNKASTREARFIKALDKIETSLHLAESGHEKYKYPEFLASYADEAVKNFPELLPMLKIVKEKLKEEFIKGGFEWKEEYEKV